MVHQVLALKYANKNKTINLKKTALLKKLVNFKEITWIRINFFQCGSRIRIRINIKIKLILNTDFFEYLKKCVERCSGRKIPDELGKLVKLEHLTIKRNNLESLSTQLSNMHCLRNIQFIIILLSSLFQMTLN